MAGHSNAYHILGFNDAVVEGEFEIAEVLRVKVVMKGYLIFSAIGFDYQIITGTSKDSIGRRSPFKAQGICFICGISLIENGILAMTFGKDIGIRSPITTV